MSDIVNVDVKVLLDIFNEKMNGGSTPMVALICAVALSSADAVGGLSGFAQLVAQCGATRPGERLRAARTIRGKTMADLEHVASTGFLSEFETGKKKVMSSKKLIAVCHELGIRSEWVLYGELPIEEENR